MCPSKQRRAAIDVALSTLNNRERCCAEMRVWLAERHYSEVEVEEAMAELVGSGAIDDERYARLFAEDKRELSGWGAERIRLSLVERGIDGETAERAGGTGGGYAAELERAIGLLERRGEGLDDDSSRARALGFLTRRGYEFELAHAAISATENGQPQHRYFAG